MYMSRIQVHPNAGRDPNYWHALGTEYRLHQEVWKVFSRGAHDVRRFVYRMDTHNGRPTIMAVSEELPNNGQLWTIETKPYHPKLYEGLQLYFQLRANPTCAREGKRHDVVADTRHQLRAESTHLPHHELVQRAGERWLRHHAERCGFVVDAVSVERYEKHDFRGKSSRIRYATCDFQGALTVQCPDTMLHTLRSGLGRAKAFGCGMLLVRRAC